MLVRTVAVQQIILNFAQESKKPKIVKIILKKKKKAGRCMPARSRCINIVNLEYSGQWGNSHFYSILF